MSNKKSQKRRAYNHRAKYDKKVFASVEAARLAEEAAMDLLFSAGEAFNNVEPTGSGGLWRVGDVRKAVATLAPPVEAEEDQFIEAGDYKFRDQPALQAALEAADELGIVNAGTFLAEAEELGVTPFGGVWDTEGVLVAADMVRKRRMAPVHVLAEEERSIPPTPKEVRKMGIVEKKLAEAKDAELWTRITGGLSAVNWRPFIAVARVGGILACSVIAVLFALTVYYNYKTGFRDVVILTALTTIAAGSATLAGILAAPWIEVAWRALRPRLHRPSRPSWLRIPQISRPQVRRPSWLRMPKINRLQVRLERPSWFRLPQISRPQVNLSWPNRVPRPSRREVALACLVVALIAVGALIISVWPVTEPVQVVGRLATEDGVCVPNATIVVNGAYTTTTNADGVFAIPGIPKVDEYTLEIRTADGDLLEWAGTPDGFLTSPGQDDLGELRIVPIRVAEAAATEVEVEVPIEAEAEVEPEVEVESEVEPEVEVEAVVGVESEAEVETEAELETEVEAPVEVEAEAETMVEAETATVTQTETKDEAGVETEDHVVTVESGDTLWDLLEEELGQAPTWDQIQQVVDANSGELADKGVDDAGVWVVILTIGTQIDLSAGLVSG